MGSTQTQAPAVQECALEIDTTRISIGQSQQKPGWLEEIYHFFVGEPAIAQTSTALPRAHSEAPRQELAKDSPLQAVAPVTERVQSTLSVSEESAQAFVAGRYYRSYSHSDSGKPVSSEAIAQLAQELAKQLENNAGATVSVDMNGLASFEGIKSKNDQLALKRAEIAAATLRTELEKLGVDTARVEISTSGQTIELSGAQKEQLEKLRQERNANDIIQIVRDYNDAKAGFTAEQLRLLDSFLAKNRGVEIKTELSKATQVAATQPVEPAVQADSVPGEQPAPAEAEIKPETSGNWFQKAWDWLSKGTKLSEKK